MSVPARKVRTIAPKPAMMTPFYFLKAGSLIEAKALIAGAGLITVFLAMKMVTKFVGILPLTRYFKFDKREGMYTTLMMSTGLTFGSISALFGLTNHIIDQEQYTILLTAVIGSAVVPTLIAQVWFPNLISSRWRKMPSPLSECPLWGH
jgi:Kef-type K+ transport system membrane component KefB